MFPAGLLAFNDAGVLLQLTLGVKEVEKSALKRSGTIPSEVTKS